MAAAIPDPAPVADSPAGDLDRHAGDPRFMQSLARGLLALGVVTAGRGHPVPIQAVAARTGLSVATVRRCIHTLGATGHVRANRNGAVPGPALAALAIDYAASSPLVSGCGPILDTLRGALDLTVSLTIFERGQATIVATSTPESFLKLAMPTGTVVPLHASSSGKLHLASLGEPDLADALAGIAYRAHGPYTAMSPADVRARLEEVRAQGYAVSDQELAPGLLTVSAPVRRAGGRLLGAVSASMLASEVTVRRVRNQIAPALVEAASQLARLVP